MIKTYKYFMLAVIALTVQACSKENAGSGILSFGIATEEIILASGNTPQSCAASAITSTKALSAQEIDNFVVEVPGTNIPSGYYGNIKNENYVVEAGTYMATAYSCTEEIANGTADEADKYGCIRYAGEKEFTITPGEFTNVVIPCEMTNSKVSVQLKENFLKVLKAEATTVTITTNASGDERPLSFKNFAVPENGTSGEENWATAMKTAASSSATGSGSADLQAQYAFYPAGKTLYIQIQSQRIGRPASEILEFSIPQTITTVAASWHKITIDADLSNAPTGISIWINEIVDVIDNGISIDDYNSGNLTEDL